MINTIYTKAIYNTMDLGTPALVYVGHIINVSYGAHYTVAQTVHIDTNAHFIRCTLTQLHTYLRCPGSRPAGARARWPARSRAPCARARPAADAHTHTHIYIYIYMYIHIYIYIYIYNIYIYIYIFKINTNNNNNKNKYYHHHHYYDYYNYYHHDYYDVLLFLVLLFTCILVYGILIIFTYMSTKVAKIGATQRDPTQKSYLINLHWI